MTQIFNLYCDESCHILNDHQKSMTIGTIKINRDSLPKVNEDIKSIKDKFGFYTKYEIKWTKTSGKTLSLLKEVIRYFFDTQELSFRALVIKDKSLLNHAHYKQTHNDFYYKMFYCLLNPLMEESSKYNIYFDKKDSHDYKTLMILKKVLQNKTKISEDDLKLQPVQSKEIQLMQLTDLFIGALNYYYRGLQTSQNKLNLVKDIQSHDIDFERSSDLTNTKFNIFLWKSQ